jgi:threonine/homoserine/homoserine lactone efflux protein
MFQLAGLFFLVSLSGVLSPGPLTTLSITEGARRGRWSGWWLSLGHAIAEALLVGAIAYGLGKWLTQPLVGMVIGLTGGAFLAWMGWGLLGGAWRRQLTLASAVAADAPGITRLGLVPAGIALSVGNPYWSLWWVSVGAGFILSSQRWGWLGVLVIFIVHWLGDFLWLTGVGFLVGSGRRVMSEGIYRVVLLLCGAFLILFSAYFIYSGIGFILSYQTRM